MAGGKKAAPVALMAAVLLAGCSSGSADLEQQLADVTAERDALQAQIDAIDGRYALTMENKAAVEEILANHDSYGTPAQVADLLATYATDDAKMDDDVFGAVGIRSAWFYTLFGEADAEIDTVQQWVDADGSESGSLWIWHGTNGGGHPFALIGIAVDTYDDEGMITNSWVAYPYDDEYVMNAIQGNGTETDVYGVPWEEGE
ncbi:hypothetical protein [Demequina zhanjiangensis]|uniref:SnoaL-like domain-containing protein n=1 Tax=Demequina zhanjiangensis TaxID=3051659 RepID=A0ABT8G2V6_9MICO|nr:hypothetical protein [Demequina sp. SYSU T00b26]MDN4473468.1 hypothetical protein [Demequina sp. SYSU T00b26]